MEGEKKRCSMPLLVLLGILVGLLGLISLVMAWIGARWSGSGLVIPLWFDNSQTLFLFSFWLMWVGKLLKHHKQMCGFCGQGKEAGGVCCGGGEEKSCCGGHEEHK